MIPAQKTAWLPLYEPAAHAQVRLFCFPHAGGSAQFFRAWSKHLGPRYDVCAIQQPGRWSRYREPPISDLQTLIELAIKNLGQFLPESFALFGHSIGALVAFEFARALRRKRLPQPRHLFLSGRRPPQIRVSEVSVESMSDEALVTFISDRFGGIPDAVLNDRDMLSMVLPLLRADLGLSQSYQYAAEPPLAYPITVLGGASDRTAPRPWLEGWREHTSGGFALEIFPGGHFFPETAQEAVLRFLDRRCSEGIAGQPQALCASQSKAE